MCSVFRCRCFQVMAVAGLDSSRAHRLSPTRSTRSWATPPATPASKDQSPYYTPLIRVDHPHRESIGSSQVSVRKSSWYTDDPEFSQRTYSPVHLQVPPEYHNQYHQKRGSATSLVEAVRWEVMGGVSLGLLFSRGDLHVGIVVGMTP